MKKPLVLIILDGWGYAPPSKANAISLARKPNYDRLLAEYPNTLIHTSGRAVGLPDGFVSLSPAQPDYTIGRGA